MVPAIETKNLSKTYKGGVEALKHLNLTVEKGESVGFLGPNGAGKTTTIQILLNLIKPTSGEVYLFGEELFGQERKILRNVGSLVEIPGFYDYLTPHDILSHICKIYRMPKQDINPRIKEVLDILKIGEVEYKKIGTFSTGMKRRLAIGQSFIHDPDLIILDEPTIGLDPKGVREIRDLIKELNKAGKTIFMTSHNLVEVSEISSRVVFLKKGVVIGDESMQDLQDRLSANQIELKFLRPLEQNEIEYLRELTYVKNLRYGRTTLVEYEGSQDNVHEILKAIMNKELPLYSFTPRSMTLEDLYMQLYRNEVTY